MHNKQVYNLSGKQQGELKDRLAKLKVDFKSPEKNYSEYWREERGS